MASVMLTYPEGVITFVHYGDKSESIDVTDAVKIKIRLSEGVALVREGGRVGAAGATPVNEPRAW